MRVIEGTILGLVQGLTEFLPISSSAHLRIVPEVLGWRDPGASFTAVLQLGTVLAVVVGFQGELRLIARSAVAGLRTPSRRSDPGFTFARHVVIGTIPIVLLGAAGAPLIDGPLRNLVVVAGALLVGTVWLWTSTRRTGRLGIEQATNRYAALIGLAQAAALVPGVSRSGATIGVAFRLGFSPEAAARYSFVLSVPAIVLAGLFGLRDVNGSLAVIPAAVGVAVAFVSGLLSLRLILRLVVAGRFAGLAVYRVVLAGVALGLALR